MAKATLIRRKCFFATHRYYDENLSEQENKRIYGSCAAEKGHSHNYEVHAHFQGEVDSRTGFCVDLDLIDRTLDSVIRELDQSNLNFDVEQFKSRMPTTENIAIYLHTRITDSLGNDSQLLKKVVLYESRDLRVEYPG